MFSEPQNISLWVFYVTLHGKNVFVARKKEKFHFIFTHFLGRATKFYMNTLIIHLMMAKYVKTN